MTERALICNVLTHVGNMILAPKMLFAWLKAIEQFANVQVVGLVILMPGVSNTNVKLTMIVLWTKLVKIKNVSILA
jgi:hypothetical protein